MQFVASPTELVAGALRACRRHFVAVAAFSAEVAEDADIVRIVLGAAAEVLGAEPITRGFGFWMDAAFLGAAGIDTVVMGARGDGAHAEVEWADIDSHVQLAEILARSARRYCGEGSAG